jgi:hypothetical protein
MSLTWKRIDLFKLADAIGSVDELQGGDGYEEELVRIGEDCLKAAYYMEAIERQLAVAIGMSASKPKIAKGKRK